MSAVFLKLTADQGLVIGSQAQGKSDTYTHTHTHNGAKTNLCVRISREIKMSYIFKATLTPFDRVNLPIIVPFSNLAL